MNKLIRENRITKEELLVDETIFSVANGYLGTRGTFVEGYGSDFEYNQTYLNGFYDYYDYFYEENFKGFPQKGQKIVNLIDGQKIEVIINKVPLNISNCEVVSLKREYDLEKGITIRNIKYRTLENYEFILTETKLVSTEFKELIAIKLEVKSLNYDGEIVLKSYLQESIKNKVINNDPRVHGGFTRHLEITKILKEDKSIMSRTKQSGLSLISTIIHNEELDYLYEDNKIIGEKKYNVKALDSISITKYVIHTSNLYHSNYLEYHLDYIKKLDKISFVELLEFQIYYYKEFWATSYIKVDGDNNIEDLLNYNIYQLNSSGAESEYHNIAAKGLSGEGYEGHYFWDTEIYLIPFFALTNPVKARNLLMYRYNTLDKAKKEAINLGYSNGAKIPWRTINGDETSPYYPAGSAQYHINSDVSYAVIKYYEVTNDLEFMVNYGFEILIETARFLAQAVDYKDGLYHLFGVTGPDEYTALVDDNYYTNQLLQFHFEYIHSFYYSNIDILKEVTKSLNINEDEISKFLEISEHIYLPFNKELNIYAQDSSFLSKKKLDLKSIPKEKFPLLLNYHPLYLYNHQVIKQADALLSMVLLDIEDESILRDSFNYYEKITTHDSSLSKCIHSIAAFRLKKTDLGCSYFAKVLETDYFNTHKNTDHGLHVANLGGSYLSFVFGLFGLSIHQDYLSISPKTTKKIRGYELSVMYKGSKVSFKVGKSLEISTENEVVIKIKGKKVFIKGNYKVDLQK